MTTLQRMPRDKNYNLRRKCVTAAQVCLLALAFRTSDSKFKAANSAGLKQIQHMRSKHAQKPNTQSQYAHTATRGPIASSANIENDCSANGSQRWPSVAYLSNAFRRRCKTAHHLPRKCMTAAHVRASAHKRRQVEIVPALPNRLPRGTMRDA